MFDQFHVPDKDPDYVYRWCNTDDRAMLQRCAQGYEPVLAALTRQRGELAARLEQAELAWLELMEG